MCSGGTKVTQHVPNPLRELRRRRQMHNPSPYTPSDRVKNAVCVKWKSIKFCVRVKSND